jgi:hypothetical protein
LSIFPTRRNPVAQLLRRRRGSVELFPKYRLAQLLKSWFPMAMIMDWKTK